MRKTFTFKILCLIISLSLITITPVARSKSVSLKAPRSIEKADEVIVKSPIVVEESSGLVESYRQVDQVPKSPALDLLEEAEFASAAKETQAESRVALAAEESRGNPIDSVKSFLELYKAGINDLEVYLVDIGDGLQEFYANYYDNEGQEHVFISGIYYDEAAALIYGKDNNGVFALGFDFDIRQLTIYAAEDGWNRAFGFCELYDHLSPLVNYEYETIRVKFNYDDKDWLIQLWKGRYIVAMGGEIGVYYKPETRLIEFYDCADDDHLLPISMRLSMGRCLLFERELQDTWWQSGVRILTPIVKPSMLTMQSTIVFPNDEMRQAFVTALDELEAGTLTYDTDKNAVNILW